MKEKEKSKVPTFQFKFSYIQGESTLPPLSNLHFQNVEKDLNMTISQIATLEHLEETTNLSRIYEKIKMNKKEGINEKALLAEEEINSRTLVKSLLKILHKYGMIGIVNGFEDKLLVEHSFLKAWTFPGLNILICPWLQCDGEVNETLVIQIRNKVLYELSKRGKLSQVRTKKKKKRKKKFSCFA